MTASIEAQPPATWQELEACIARILRECGYNVEVQKNVQLARGDVNIDVWADDHSSPPNVIAIECKLWSTPVPKSVVHGFRTVVGDSGANTGLIVSSAGFQQGAVEAAVYSNVRLMNWSEFQQMFADRWYRCYMAPRLYEEAAPLTEYTEPINLHILRKAAALPYERRQQFDTLRDQYIGLGMGTVSMYLEMLGEALVVPDLPIRDRMPHPFADDLPDPVLDASALRPLLGALTEAYRKAIKEFDQVFGERAGFR